MNCRHLHMVLGMSLKDNKQPHLYCNDCKSIYRGKDIALLEDTLRALQGQLQYIQETNKMDSTRRALEMIETVLSK